ncbi:MAG TPA: amino acid adenylation domain-containing protein, partial [Thermoanaerobaculia bacterium]|nr:amino acid adenylation domain-containing protein [Thermoanaerobaculia bacterium]
MPAGAGDLRRRVLSLDAPADGEPAEASGAPLPEARLDHPIYAIYTSGSTGRPKGALNTHGGVLNRVLWMRDRFGVGPGDRFLQKTPLGFDVSAWELFLPLTAGARLVLARPGGHRDPAYLRGVVEREGVTLLHFVPSMLQAFLGQPDLGPGSGACPSLRWVFSGGEALSPALVGAFRRTFACGLHNFYGPTEASISAVTWPCPPRGEPAAVPIGRPMANARALVVDGSLRPVPVGVPGELVLGGVPPGRGYLRRPALTAERFVPDPAGGGPGARVYRTGHLCRTLSGGTMEFLGRLDFQVKVRGQRIETGEIEAALLRHPAVREAVVVPRTAPGPGGSLSLAAWITLAPGSAPPEAELRRHLQTALPEAMVPAAMAVLDELPLNASGKVDRAALARRPLPDGGAADGDGYRTRTPPRTPLERELARVWCEVLGIEDPAVDDDFFHVGGNSIAAAVVTNRLRGLLGESVPVVAIFDAPTVAGLAAWVTEHLPEAAARLSSAAGGEAAGAPFIERLPRPAGGAPASFAPSFAPERLWFLDRMEPGRSLYNLPVALRLTGRLRRPVLARLLAELVRRHETLRTTFPEVAGAPVQRVAAPGPLPLPVIDLSGLGPETRVREARRLAREEAETPFDLARGPLFRARLLDLGAATAGAAEAGREHRLLLGFHHIVADGWSMGVLLDEVAALYAALAAGEAAALPPEPPVQYADFAAWQRSWLEGDALQRQLDYWRGELAGVPAVLELPGDRPRPAVP